MQKYKFLKSGRGLSLTLLALLVATFLATSLDVQPSQADNSLTYFPLTGHYSVGVFKAYWEQNGGLEQFGYPLTELVQEKSPTDGQTYITQYFERAIFEYHPEFAGSPYQVLLRLAGSLQTQGRKFPAATVTASKPGTNYFPQTQHTLTGNFLTYWTKFGGLPVYGYPLSEPFQELNPADNKTYTVQYFERSRLEYHPEYAGTRYEVLQGLLGWQLLTSSNISQLARNPQPAGKSLAEVSTVVSATPVVPLTITPLSIPTLGYGMNVWLFGQDKDRVLGFVKGAGFNWVRQQVKWADLETSPGQYQWQELDNIVNALDRNGVRAIFSIVTAPGWAGIGGSGGLPADPANFGRLMSQMAARYKDKIPAYEVWNEQNLALETGGKVQVKAYVETLKAGYTAIKAADPKAIVLYGGLSPTGINDPGAAVDDATFLEQCYQYNNGEMRNYFDVLGAHPGGAANSPDEFWPSDAPTDKTRPFTTHPSFYFRRVENLRSVMEKYGDSSKQMWLTEFGWTTKNAAPGYEYGALISEDVQAKYLVRAYQRAKTTYPWMGVMSLWQLNFATFLSPNDEKAPWGLLRADFSTRPAYEALKAMSK